MKARLEFNGDCEKLILELPLFDPPQISRSGKTWLIATSGRAARTNVTIDDKPVYVCCNAFYYESEKKKCDDKNDD